LKLNPSVLDFGSSTYGATQPAAQSVLASNAGDVATGDLTLGGALAASYTISPDPVPSIAFESSRSFDVRPKSNLDAGDYSGTITVGNTNVPEKEINVSYTVNQATPVITFANFEAYTGATNVAPGATVNPSSLQSSLTYSIVGDNSIGVTTDGTTVNAGATAGTVTIRATVASTTNYTSATKDATFTVKGCPGTIIYDGAYAVPAAGTYTTGLNGTYSANWNNTSLFGSTAAGNLCWNATNNSGTPAWAAAGTACTNMGSGWRLPTLRELQVLYQALGGSGASTDGTNLGNLPSEKGTQVEATTAMTVNYYWSSTEYSSDGAYIFGFVTGSGSGYRYNSTKTVTGHYSRCVRSL
jgi:hypothetical protein